MNADNFQFNSKRKIDARHRSLLGVSVALLLVFVWPISAQSDDAGVMSRNAAGNSRNVTNDSSYVEIPSDSPPETFYTITYNQGTDSEGEAGWHDELDGSGQPVDDFKRTFQLNFQDVERAFPMAFRLGIKGPNPPLPEPTFTVTGAAEKDAVDGNTSKPYTAFYMTESITDATEVLVRDDLKTLYVSSPDFEFYRRWSLGRVSRAEPVAITSSQLFEIDELKYGLVVPLSAGGDYLSSIDPDSDKPVYNKSLRALYLHKPDRMKVTLSWEPASAVRVWHTPFKARTDGSKYYDGEIQNGQAFYEKDDENPVFIEIVESQEAKLRWGIDDRYHEIDLIPVELEKVDRDDPSKTWADSVAYNSGDPIYAGQSNGDMIRWSIGDGSLTDVTFTWLAEHPDGTALVGPSGVGEYEWIIADENPSNGPNKWVDWKPGTWTIKCYLNGSLVEFEQEIGVRTEEYFALGRVTADVDPPESGVDLQVLSNWSCPGTALAAAAAQLGGVNDTDEDPSVFFVPFNWVNRMYASHQLLNSTSNLNAPPIDENLEPEDAFGLDKLQHYRFFVYGHFKFLTDGNEFSELPQVINKVALVGGTPIPCLPERDTGPLGDAHADNGVHRFIEGDSSKFEFIGKVRAGSAAVDGNANVNGRELPWAFLRLRFNPDDGIIDTNLTDISTDPDGPDNLDFSGVPNIVILRRYFDLDETQYRVELVDNLEESQDKREEFFLSGAPVPGKPYLLERE